MAFSFDFDAEEVWIGEDPANASRPGVLSQGTYGAKVALPLILDLLKRHDLRATFFVPGRVAERHPQRVREIIAAGHEVGHHGYTHTSPTKLSHEEEEEELLKGRRVLESLGARVVGYRSPSWDFSPSTLSLLEKHGFAYSSNLMDDIRPYRHKRSSIIEIPIQWILDDAPYFWFADAYFTKRIAPVSEVKTIWEDELSGIRRLGGSCVFTMHPQFIGRPSRLTLLEAMIELAQGFEDVWLATVGEVAERANVLLPEAEQRRAG